MEGGKLSIMSSDGEDMSEQLNLFTQRVGLERVAPGRFSVLFSLSLFGGYMSGRLNPAKVLRELEALEGVGRPSKLKPPIQNRHPPLKGLWHKHYMQDGIASMAMNVRRGLYKFGMPYLEQQIREARSSGEERYITPDMVGSLVDDVVAGNLQRLSEAQSVTGEWILYAVHEGKNYYLSLATHDVRFHGKLREQVDQICCHEFPFLTQILERP